MKLRTVVRDCLFLNWALPVEVLPEPPAPLRYQRHAWQGRDYVFVSALLFHHDAVRLSAFPLVRVGYPQLNVRLYVLDEDGVPSVLFQRELMPAWVAPGVRLVSHHPAAGARLDFPRPSRRAGAGSWSWRAERGGVLAVRAWVHSPAVGEGPRLGSWDETVRYIQDRPRGYAVHGGALHRVEASHPPVEAVWPLAAEVSGSDSMLRRLLPLAPGLPLASPATLAAHAPHDQELAPARETARPLDGRGPGTRRAGAAGDGDGPDSPGGGHGASATAVLAAPAAAPASQGAAAAATAAAAPGGGFSWPALHSSWLCPEMPFSIAFDLVPKVQPVVQHLPHPAAGRISSPALRGAPSGPLNAAAMRREEGGADPMAAGARVLASAA